MKGQSKFKSFIESLIIEIIGFGVALLAQFFVFPLFGMHVQGWAQIQIALIFSFVGIIRAYAVRRWFNYREEEK